MIISRAANSPPPPPPPATTTTATMKTSEQEQRRRRRDDDGSLASSSQHYLRTDGTVVSLPNNARLVDSEEKVSRASRFENAPAAALSLARSGGSGGKEEARRWWQFFRKDRTRTKLAKLALLLVALFVVSSSSSMNPNSNPKRHASSSSSSFNGNEEEASNDKGRAAAVKISGPKTALSSMFSLAAKNNNFPSSAPGRKEALERRERLMREQRANERERLEQARYGPANEALRGSRELEATRNFGNGMVNRIDWKAKTNQLGREYKEYRRMMDRENRWDGRSQRYGILSRDDGSSNSNP